MKNNVKIIVFIFTILFIVILLKFRDLYAFILEKTLIISDKEIVFNDEFTMNYIKSLENDIKEFNYINNLQCINASVIYRNPIIWYDELTINKGLNDGINVNDYVLTKDGLVGKISKAYDTTSLVSLLTNMNGDNNITVEIKTNSDSLFGLISEYDKFNNVFLIKELTKNIEIGYEVVTTSFTNTYKQGLLIGNVIDINEDENGLSKNAIVRPISNYNNIRNVCVTK